VAIILAGVASSASPARATDIDPSTLTSGQQSTIGSKILNWDTAGQVNNVESGLFEAAELGAVEPGPGTIIAGIIAGSYVTYKIADGLGLGGFVYRRITGEDYQGGATQATVSVDGVKWVNCSTAGGLPGCTTACNGGACFNQTLTAVAIWGAVAINPQPNASSRSWGTGCNGDGLGAGAAASNAVYAAVKAMGVTINNQGTGAICTGNGLSVVPSATQTQAVEDAILCGSPSGFKCAPADATQYAADPNHVDASGSSKATTCNATCVTNALNGMHCHSPSLQTIKEAQTCTYLAQQAGLPTVDVFVLEPKVNETYFDYVGRLRAEGWLGTLTTTAESTAVSGYGPNSPTKVSYTDGNGVKKTLDPLKWPATVPTISPGTAITIRFNPSTASVVGTDTATDTCGTSDNPCVTQDNTTGPDEGADNCSTCAIDWTPIESLDVGSKFPFGVPQWSSDFLGGVSFADSCPTLSIGKPSALGGGSIDIPFCSTEWEDTYRPIVFPILEALMTLAAITFLGIKLFGMGGGETE